MHIQHNEPLSKHSTWRVGGPARFFVEVAGSEELVKALEWARPQGLEYVVIGGGTNILVADSGFDGLVIKMVNRDIKIEGDRIIAGAGALTSMVARTAAGAGLTGLEWAVTIPGTIGGAVYGNAGCYGGEMGKVVESIQVLTGKTPALSPEGIRASLNDSLTAVYPTEDLNFAYRNSALKSSDDIVLEVSIKLKPSKPDKIEAKMDECLTLRKRSQPLGSSCAGCVFKNPEGDSAGRLIDEAGLKG
ncbi:MAG: UDP-N-acetylmuramate dehydrogenase, partial [Candidatus Uhrbacteria bacterium]